MYNKQLPLIDLHRHLDGNIRPKTVWQLAQKNNIQLPEANFEDFLPHIKITNNEADLLAFLKKLDWGVKVITSLDDVIRIGYENVEDAYLANIDYAELRFSPFYMAMTHQLPIEGVVEAIIEGVNQGCKKYPTKINLIGILSRTFGVENCQTELNAILAHKDNIVALDLAGDEYNFPGHLFESHFKKALDAGLQITAHAGEAAGPESVWHAIEKLGATRIGHGVACVKDHKLMDYMRKHEIGLESCLTSNYQTGTIKDLTKHPIKTFLANGLNVCLNTDDPAVENIELEDEFNLASKLLKLNEEQITQLQTNAIEMSFLSNEEKQSLRELKI
ncbi:MULTISPECIES: adenosine deaminase [unclassified Colwellia]|uniref:adenosine deaminase n=1 Tax=unclassified Colwellia TaxID=196834 RepID=UPI0015F5E7E8|nr:MULTISPECIES: adenosine deaminase [unclassified Colwellia]MBA6232920.1 adenosine deaminase [Colwellia sp. MB02u-7]MBA6237054.1 adenosine deaminase [Colwellia sp. MB02u-11]MBA6299467.1 adenosine deaminase [Colwellia sp. MB3u-22]MBA6304539.1 adenosine deaminase [Colwellia sp. MB02u-14]MBA6311567.1 adenosine deaminase [Colwellia sp. MB3u-64]